MIINHLKNWLKSKLWPAYRCEDCIGMGEWGCYCDFHEAYAPGGPKPPIWVRIGRATYKKIWKENDV